MGIPVFTVRREYHRASTFFLNEVVYDGTPQSVLPLIQHELRGVCQEHHAIITLDHASRVTGFAVTGIGSQTGVSSSPKEFYRYALANDAAFAIAIHTHPGKCARPSEQDRSSYRALHDAGTVLGILLVDDLIVAENGRHFSFNEEEGRKHRRKQVQVRDRLVAKARRSIAAGSMCAREIVLVAAADLADLVQQPAGEQMPLIESLVATLSPVAGTTSRIWRGTRQRAQVLLDYLEEIRPSIERGEFPDLQRMASVLGFDITPQGKQPTYTTLPEFIPYPRALSIAAVPRQESTNEQS